jgi:excisionase family DNA binding protein
LNACHLQSSLADLSTQRLIKFVSELNNRLFIGHSAGRTSTSTQETFMRFCNAPTTSALAFSPRAIAAPQLPHKPEPKRDENLLDLNGVARVLGVSKRFVQSLVARKAIPVIRLGRRCVRFDLNAVLAALKKFEIHEIGR